MLRKACKANGLGTSGTAAQLLARMFNASAKKPKTTIRKNEKKPKKKPKTTATSKHVQKPKSQVPLKLVKNGKGRTRLSASYYFHTICKGKISHCASKMILQPDVKTRLKEIRIVNGAHGKHPRWVNVDSVCDLT